MSLASVKLLFKLKHVVFIIVKIYSCNVTLNSFDKTWYHRKQKHQSKRAIKNERKGIYCNSTVFAWHLNQKPGMSSESLNCASILPECIWHLSSICRLANKHVHKQIGLESIEVLKEQNKLKTLEIKSICRCRIDWSVSHVDVIGSHANRDVELVHCWCASVSIAPVCIYKFSQCICYIFLANCKPACLFSSDSTNKQSIWCFTMSSFYVRRQLTGQYLPTLHSGFNQRLVAKKILFLHCYTLI